LYSFSLFLRKNEKRRKERPLQNPKFLVFYYEY